MIDIHVRREDISISGGDSDSDIGVDGFLTVNCLCQKPYGMLARGAPVALYCMNNMNCCVLVVNVGSPWSVY